VRRFLIWLFLPRFGEETHVTIEAGRAASEVFTQSRICFLGLDSRKSEGVFGRTPYPVRIRESLGEVVLPKLEKTLLVDF